MSAPASTRTVDRALQLLVGVTDHAEGASLSELARAADLSPSTASRLLTTLAQHQFVRRVDDGGYRAGSRLLQIAAGALRGEPIYELAGPRLAALATSTGETANLGIAIEGDPARALYLRQAASPRLVQTASWTGRTIPMDGTALGAALRGEVGPQGYASTAASVEPDVTAVAAPVAGLTGGIVAALSVIAPTYRTSAADVERIGRLLVEQAHELSAELGGRPTLVAA